MRYILFSIIALVISISQVSAQIYISEKCEIVFFSTTPIEDITAVNTKTIPFLNTKTGDIQMKLSMTAFIFEKPLMQEHFNENYVESEKFPYAIFKGKIIETIDYTNDGTYPITVTGKMTIHGVEKEKTIKGTVKVDMNKLILSSKFKINFEEYGVVIPSLYQGVIPPETEVKFDATLVPFKK